MQYFEYLTNARMQLYYKPGVGAEVGAGVGAAGFIRKYYKKILKVKQ